AARRDADVPAGAVPPDGETDAGNRVRVLAGDVVAAVARRPQFDAGGGTARVEDAESRERRRHETGAILVAGRLRAPSTSGRVRLTEEPLRAVDELLTGRHYGNSMS